MFSLKLFGGASIEGPDGPLTGRAVQRRRLALLALLAAAPERGLTREKLVGYLWPERDPERARHALSDSVYRLNRALGGDAVPTVGGELRLDPAVVRSDIGEFRDAIAAGAWETAVDVYTGPFLDGFFLSDAVEFERWADAERDRLARSYARALESLAEERSERGDPAGAVGAWRRLATHDPYDGRIAVRLMEALAGAGNRAGAIRHARIHAQLLEEEFGTEPDREVDALAERLRTEPAAGDEDDDAPDGTPAVVAGGGEPSAGESSASPARPAGPARGDAKAAAARRVPLRAVVAGVAIVVLALAAGLALWVRSEPASSASGSARVAVLPFESLGASDETGYFADGVTEDIVTNLAGVPEMLVISSASLAAYGERDTPIATIADELGVDYVLRGSVRRDGDRVRINARLTDARAETHVWADSYDRRLADIFAVQSDIATRVAAELDAEITAGVSRRIERAPTADLDAYNLYLRGRYFWHRRTESDLLESARFFQRAVARDSGFAQAWAGLADAYAVLAFYDYLPPDTAYPAARRAAERALAIEPMLAEAHASAGYIALYYEWDAAKAETAFQRAIRLNPSYSVAHQWYANHLVATGRFDEAAREMSRAREVNPLSLIANGALGWVYYYAGRYEDAIRQCDLALEMNPDWDLCHLWRGQVYEQMGRSDDAVASLRRAVELSGGSGISLAALAHAHATFGEQEAARRLLAELLAREGYRPSFEIAKVHLALGDTDAAIEWLERAHDQHAHSMAFLLVDPQLAALRPDPRFVRLAERVGL